MAKNSKSEKHREAPYLISALFCENVLVEAGGVQSLIRIIDQITLEVAFDPSVKSDSSLPPLTASATLVVSIKGGEFTGEGDLRVDGIAPDGSPMNPPSVVQRIDLKDGGIHGHVMRMQMSLPATSEGCYWFEIFFNDRFLTRTPLSILVSQTAKSAESEQATD